MTGYLHSKGTRISEHAVRLSLRRVAPESHDRRRQDIIDKTNPVPYVARYFGHKFHLDQNEKLIRYGVTHVMMVDGFSGLIVANTTMTIKNNLIIYEYIYRYLLDNNNLILLMLFLHIIGMQLQHLDYAISCELTTAESFICPFTYTVNSDKPLAQLIFQLSIKHHQPRYVQLFFHLCN